MPGIDNYSLDNYGLDGAVKDFPSRIYVNNATDVIYTMPSYSTVVNPSAIATIPASNNYLDIYSMVNGWGGSLSGLQFTLTASTTMYMSSSDYAEIILYLLDSGNRELVVASNRIYGYNASGVTPQVFLAVDAISIDKVKRTLISSYATNQKQSLPIDSAFDLTGALKLQVRYSRSYAVTSFGGDHTCKQSTKEVNIVAS